MDLLDERRLNHGQNVNSDCETQLGTGSGPYTKNYDEIFPLQVQTKLDTTGKNFTNFVPRINRISKNDPPNNQMPRK